MTNSRWTLLIACVSSVSVEQRKSDERDFGVFPARKIKWGESKNANRPKPCSSLLQKPSSTRDRRPLSRPNNLNLLWIEEKCITTINQVIGSCINIFINGFDKIIIWHPFLLDQMRIKWVYRPDRSSLFLLNDSSGKLDLTRSGNEQLIKLLDYTPRGDSESFHTYSEVYYHEEIGLGWFHFTLKNPVASIMESFAQSLSSDPLWWHLNRFNDQFITD